MLKLRSSVKLSFFAQATGSARTVQYTYHAIAQRLYKKQIGNKAFHYSFTLEMVWQSTHCHHVTRLLHTIPVEFFYECSDWMIESRVIWTVAYSDLHTDSDTPVCEIWSRPRSDCYIASWFFWHSGLGQSFPGWTLRNFHGDSDLYETSGF